MSKSKFPPCDKVLQLNAQILNTTFQDAPETWVLVITYKQRRVKNSPPLLLVMLQASSRSQEQTIAMHDVVVEYAATLQL